MQDQLQQIYLESVANPTKADKFDRHEKKPVTTVKEGDDFGFQKKGFQKGTGPEAKKKDLQKVKEKEDMKEQAPVVGSQFDSLFSKTIKEDFEPADDSEDFGAPTDDMEFDSGEGDEFGDDEMEPEADLRTALTGIIDQLQEILSNVEGGEEGEDEFGGVEDGEDEFGDIGGGEDIEDLQTASRDVTRRPFREDAKMGAMTKSRDGKMGKATDGRGKLQSKSNKVGGYFGKKTGSSAASHGADGKPRDGRLRPGPNYKSLQGKDNKVHQPGVAGSKAGTSLFGS